jgi:hypothetical protein
MTHPTRHVLNKVAAATIAAAIATAIAASSAAIAVLDTFTSISTSATSAAAVLMCPQPGLCLLTDFWSLTQALTIIIQLQMLCKFAIGLLGSNKAQ